MTILNYIKSFLLILTILVISFGYHPNNFDINGEVVNTGQYSLMAALIVVILIFSIFEIRASLSLKPIINYILLLIPICLINLVLFSIDKINDFSEIRTMMIPLIAMLIGSSLRLNDKQIIAICLIYILSILYIGYLQISVNIGDFIVEDLYLSNAKNSFGPMVAMAGIIALLISLNNNYNVLIRFFALIAVIISLLEVATIRARFATIILLALSALLVFLYFRKTKVSIKKNHITIILSLLVITYVAVVYKDYIIDSIFRNREDDITSGRVDTYYDGISIFVNNPLFGNLFENQDIGWVHNYLLLKLSSYGLVFAFPLLYLYFYIIKIIVIGIKKTNIFSPQNFGFIIILISFLVSLAEPTYPYGPGTTNFFPFILLGISIQSNNIYNRL